MPRARFDLPPEFSTLHHPREFCFSKDAVRLFFMEPAAAPCMLDGFILDRCRLCVQFQLA